MILQMEDVMAILDPVILIYLSIGVVLFITFSYSKPELKMFIIPMVALWVSILFMAIRIELFESMSLAVSGTSMVFSILYYQSKVKSNQK